MEEHDTPGDKFGEPDIEVVLHRDQVVARVDQQEADGPLIIPARLCRIANYREACPARFLSDGVGRGRPFETPTPDLGPTAAKLWSDRT